MGRVGTTEEPAEMQVPPLRRRSGGSDRDDKSEFGQSLLHRAFAVFLQPLQFFAHFDLSVPRILLE
jgi:hypothetical protein